MKEQRIAVVEDGRVYVLQSGTPVFVKTADICAITGKSNQWVGQLTSQGTINKTKTPYGAMYAIDCLGDYCAMLEERTVSDGSDPEQQRLERDKQKADTSIKASKAVIASLEAKELQGKMHRSEDVAAMTEDLIFAFRGALLALPGRLSVAVASVSEPAEVSAIIQTEVYKVMDELSAYKYDSKKYEERVRARLNKDPVSDTSDDAE